MEVWQRLGGFGKHMAEPVSDKAILLRPIPAAKMTVSRTPDFPTAPPRTIQPTPASSDSADESSNSADDSSNGFSFGSQKNQRQKTLHPRNIVARLICLNFSLRLHRISVMQFLHICHGENASITKVYDRVH